MAPPGIRDRNPFIPIAVLVVTMALVAGFGMRFGMSSFIAALCVFAAIVGTWVLLSPQLDGLEVATTGAATSAFTPTGEAAREQLRSTPRLAVGFSDPATENDLLAEASAPVQALGQLPRDAAQLEIATQVEPAPKVVDAFTLASLEIRGASRRGTDHAILDEPRQDDYVVVKSGNGRYLIVVVADGLGIAEHAHYGSYWSCRLLAQEIDRNLRDGVPGIEKMLTQTRDTLAALFEATFPDGTKLRSIATTLVGLIAPVDGGPAAGFRVGDGDILHLSDHRWSSVFSQAPRDPSDAVFPRSIDAEVAPVELDSSCLLLATDGVTEPFTGSPFVAATYARALQQPVTSAEFEHLMEFEVDNARGDRTAVGVWFGSGSAVTER